MHALYSTRVRVLYFRFNNALSFIYLDAGLISQFNFYDVTIKIEIDFPDIIRERERERYTICLVAF